MYWELCTAQQLSEFYAEFNATEESAKNDVRYLMKWLEEHPTLPNVKGILELTVYIDILNFIVTKRTAGGAGFSPLHQMSSSFP